MASNFDEMIDRRNTASLKWDVEENELPMWVADMDFATASCVLEAMKKRLNHGIFGYTVIPEQWYEAYVGWWKKRHHFEMEKDWLVFCTGVVPAISSIVRKLTTPAEKVLIQTPVYNIFFNSILNNGRQVLESPLVLDSGSFRELEPIISCGCSIRTPTANALGCITTPCSLSCCRREGLRSCSVSVIFTYSPMIQSASP